MRTVLIWAAVTSVGLAGGAAACSSDEASDAEVVVSTSVLGDVVRQLVGEEVTVDVLMPAGSDPHDFVPSPKEVAAMRSASVLVVNGLGLEEGLQDTIDAAVADGVPVVVAADGLGGEPDPHFATDPVAMGEAVEHLADRLLDEVAGLDGGALADRRDAYLAELVQLDADIRELLAPVPAERRRLVTNHDVLGPFAERYDFEVLGTVLPGPSTLAEPSAADLAALADAIRRLGVPAVFAETSAPDRLAAALAAEGTDVEVVELYSEALGPAGSDGATYLDMMRTNARRIAAALA